MLLERFERGLNALQLQPNFLDLLSQITTLLPQALSGVGGKPQLGIEPLNRLSEFVRLIFGNVGVRLTNGAERVIKARGTRDCQ